MNRVLKFHRRHFAARMPILRHVPQKLRENRQNMNAKNESNCWILEKIETRTKNFEAVSNQLFAVFLEKLAKMHFLQLEKRPKNWLFLDKNRLFSQIYGNSPYFT